MGLIHEMLEEITGLDEELRRLRVENEELKKRAVTIEADANAWRNEYRELQKLRNELANKEDVKQLQEVIAGYRKELKRLRQIVLSWEFLGGDEGEEGC